MLEINSSSSLFSRKKRAFFCLMMFSAFVFAPLFASAASLKLVVIGDLANPPYAVQAITDSTSDVRVVFFVDGVSRAKENYYPYSLFGDDGVTCKEDNLGTGSHTITAELYQQTSDVALASASSTITESPVAFGSVAFAMGRDGLASLTYKGVSFLGSVDAWTLTHNVSAWFKETGMGDWEPNSSFVSGNSLTRTFNWGSVRFDYSASGNRFTVATTVTNKSSGTIYAVHATPLVVGFPAAVSAYLPNMQHNITGPSIVTMDAGTTRVVTVNENLNKPLTMGFPWSIDDPDHTTFPLRFDTARTDQYPNSFPYINRDIAPGASDTFTISLRFGTTSDTPEKLAADIFTRIASEVPFKLKWPDRRPIGMLGLASTMNCRPGLTNPRGWFNDASLKITDPNSRDYPYGPLNMSGVAAFHTRLFQWADYAIAVLKNMKAQGMILYDVEGEWFWQFVTYIGDPRMTDRLAPELAVNVTYQGVQMKAIDVFFKKFRDAGLKTGLCINHMKLMTNNNYTTGGDEQTWQEGADVFKDHNLGFKISDSRSLAVRSQNLIDKISYAKSRWGCTMFYADSSHVQGLDNHVWKRVLEAHPDVLISPEYFGPFYPWAYMAPLMIPDFAGQGGHTATELGTGLVKSGPLLTSVYPEACSIIRVGGGTITDDNTQTLTESVRRGDILMFPGWYNDQDNAKVKAIYEAAAR